MKDDHRPLIQPFLERCSFVAMTARDLARARSFWAGDLLCPVLEEEEDEYLIVDAGGLKLCIDVDAGRAKAKQSDPVLAFSVSSVTAVVSALRTRGVPIVKVEDAEDDAKWAEILDPDGHTILLTESA
jgi:catechol 2,3-dioxygenase-like lactoylglutathione lyase family enzyme